MSQQALDLRRSLQTVRRYRTLVGLVAALGLAAGAVYTVLSPPMLSSKALVVLSPETRDVGTQLVIASSDSVLKRAMRSADPAVSIATLRGRVHVSSLTSNLIAISAQGKTAAQAEDTANAVAASYISYTSSPNSPAGRVLGRVLQTATTATGMSMPESLLITGGIGALVGALIGAIVALAIGRNDRRLRERDEMASAIGVPVLASIPVGHPSDVAGWTKLLGGYEPGVVHAWSMRKALHHLGLTDLSGGHGASLAVLSLSSDTGALALGPHLAVFAASLGIPTELVISPQHDTNAAATLFAACTVMSTSSRRSSHLSIIAGNHENTDRQSGAGLTIVVAVVDGRNPRVADTVRATTTVLGVSAAAATAEQLARVAVSAAGDGREIAGIIVADPDSLDHTTGRIPQRARPGATETTDTAGRWDDGDQAVTTARVTGADAPKPTWAVADNFAAVGERPAADLGAGLTSLSFIGTAMRRRARLWCAIAVAGLLLGLGFRVLFPPAYQASTSVLLTHGAIDNPADSMLTDVTLAQSRSVAQRVMAKLRLHESVGSFLAAYTVTATTDRVLLITVSAPSSSQAVLRAGALATQFLQLRAQALQIQQRLEVATLDLRVTQAKQEVRSLATLIAQLSAKAAFPGRRAQLNSLRTQYNQENRALIGLEQAATGYPVTTVSMVHGSEILDAAAAVPHSRLRLIIVYAGTGLIAGLAVGLGLVVIQALVSDRLRRRDDVADALGAPVSLSVGRVRARRVLGRWLPGRPGLKPARGREVRRIVAHLRGAVPGSSRRAAALAVVPVDNASAVAVPLVSLALSCAQEGNRVVVADLAPGSPAAHLLGTTGKPGVSAVSVNGALLVVAIPDRDDVAPVGPLHRISPQVGPAADQSAVGEALAAAYAVADLLLTLAPLDPSFGAEHLTTWATDTVAVVTAGQSSATRIHAVGEMIRLAGTRLVCAVLIGADKTDESLGAARTPSYRRRPTPDPEIVSR